MADLGTKLDEFCNPFKDDARSRHFGQSCDRPSCKKETEAYLLETMKRGKASREKFQEEWDQDSTRFLKPVKRTKVNNFASEIEKKKKQKSPAAQTALMSAESMRDMFIRMIVVVAENTSFDLKRVLSHPITAYPLSLSHSDGAYLKTMKSSLLNKLESLQTETTVIDLPDDYVKVYDGGLLVHSVLSQVNSGASYGSIARSIQSTICSGRG